MKCEYIETVTGILGLNLIAEDELDNRMIKKFHDEGIKLNGVSVSGDSFYEIQITFKGLIGFKKPPLKR